MVDLIKCFDKETMNSRYITNFVFDGKYIEIYRNKKPSAMIYIFGYSGSEKLGAIDITEATVLYENGNKMTLKKYLEQACGREFQESLEK